MFKTLFILIFCPLIVISQQKVAVKALKHVTVNNLPSTANRIAYFGDSYTANGTPILGGTKYYAKVYAATNIPYTNYAVGGTTVCSAQFDTTTGGTNLIDKYQAEIALGYTGQMVSFCYGQNDYALAANPSWKAVYKSIIQDFINAGFPKNRLLIILPPSHSTIASALANARTAIQQIANELGIMVYSAYQAFLNSGLNDTFFTSSDGYVHPQDGGYIIWAADYITFLKR